jgi:cyclic beta-1,2-glucan synthetase
MRRASFPALARLEEHECALRSLIPRYWRFVHAQIRDTREALPYSFWGMLPQENGEPRVYRAARKLFKAGETACPTATSATLTLAETWAVFPMLRLALIEDLRAAAERGDDGGVRAALAGLKELLKTSQRDFVESVSPVEQTLRRDPAGVYARADFETRDACRHAVEGIARRSGRSEVEVAELAVELAGDSGHVGYWLIGAGLAELKRRAGCRRPFADARREAIERHPAAFYLSSICVLTALITAAAFRALAPAPWWLLLLLAIPASQAALAAVNSTVHRILPPRKPPRLDFSRGIPDDCRTFAVTPALLLSKKTAERLLGRMEIHYLANRDPNLLFALLTDFPDAPQAAMPGDQALLDYCRERIERLNRRYPGSPFYLFHRDREWSQSESAWIGHERKRGKIADFNELLLGAGDAFPTKLGNMQALDSVRYVIVLDADTQLPRDAAQKMVGTLAHPLNRATIDPAAQTVRQGYTILQPRISVSIESASRSRLASLYSAHAGFDPYTTAVSDVYQDLFGQATYTGKGIYDVRAFEAVLGGRFPDSALLSHDLIEGEYARTALASDIELIDDYPATYLAYSKRKHRWIRGDWQIAPWLGRRVPLAGGKREPNPLGLVSRWKIADNLRRSLIEIALALLLVAGWFLGPGAALRTTLAAAALLAAPAWIEFAWAVRGTPRRFARAHLREAALALGRGHADALITLVFLGFQAALAADAIVRTLARMLVTRRRLLEWESMAQVEEGAARKGAIEAYVFAPVLFALGAAFVLPAGSWTDLAGLVVLEMWIASPLAALWLSRPPRRRNALCAGDAAFLRQLAVRTWRYFAELSGPAHNWLIPDNVQEDPPKTAARTSPTNIGMLLAANLAAHDFGYLTRRELAARLRLSFETLARLERRRGHFYNWYDTRTLEPLEPLYVSTVDSGNLASALVVVKQGCLECLRAPVLGEALLEGLEDHCARLDSALPPAARSTAIARTLASLMRQVRYRPHDLFAWESTLTEARALAVRLGERIEWASGRLDAAQGANARRWHGLVIERIDAALEELYAYAPWLEGPFEQELRVSSREPALANLMRALELAGPFSSLPKHYDAIRMEIEQTRKLCRPALAGTLAELLPRVEWARAQARRTAAALESAAAAAGRYVQEMDFGFLFDSEAKLLHIGYDAGARQPDAAHYDLLASEARAAVFLAIAKRDVPHEAWFRLGRRITECEGGRALVSWSGTMFEYLMPRLFTRSYDGTLMGESLKGIVGMQQAYGRARGVPWGISEAAYAARDGEGNYQYRAFGLPRVALSREAEDLVVAPYATMLALAADPRGAAANLRAMAAKGWLGRYGFYESVDFSPRRLPPHRDHEIVRAFMAHHQGMSLLALANAVLGEPMTRRFHAEPLVESAEFLLEERAPVHFASEAGLVPEAEAAA